MTDNINNGKKYGQPMAAILTVQKLIMHDVIVPLSQFPTLGTDHFLRGWWREWRVLGKYARKTSCIAFAEEIKFVQSGTKQRNLLQASEINFIQRF